MTQHHRREHCDPQCFMQWKFTSCRYNIENSNGFNTYSMSEGLSRDDKDDLIRYAGSYTPPDNLPYRPTQDEIDASFPIVFSSFPLRSGKWAVTRSVYIGQDYAGVRWGNFFSHGIIYHGGHWPFYPIRLWNSPLFANGLTTEEQQQHTPQPLPPLTIDEENLHNFSEIPRFLADRSIREQTLTALLYATKSVCVSGKTVLLRDDPAHIPVWIAAIQYAFPLRLASGISFTTFQHTLSKSQRFHITGTSLEGHAIPIKSPSLITSCHLFDLPEERLVSALEPVHRIYLDRIRCDEAVYPGNELLELHPIIDEWECKLTEDSLDKAVLLYQYLYQPWKELPAPDDFRSILKFFSAQPLPIRLRLVVEQILKKNIIYMPEMLEILFPHLLEIVVKCTTPSESKPDVGKLVFLFLMKHFARNIGPDNWKDSLERLELLETILAHMPDDIKIRFFECVSQYIVTSPNRKQLLFLYLSLLLCLYVSRVKTYRDYFAIFFDISFSEQEFSHFIHEVIDGLIDKAVNPVVFEQIMKLHRKNLPRNKGNFDFIDDFDYIPRLKRYEMNQWREGKHAKIQGVAFVRYLLGTRDKEEWSAWEYHSNILVYLLEIPFTHNKAKKVAYKTICEQMEKEKMPALEPSDVKRLKYGLLLYTTWCEQLINFCCERKKRCIFISIVVVLAIASLVLFNLCGNPLSNRNPPQESNPQKIVRPSDDSTSQDSVPPSENPDQ